MIAGLSGRAGKGGAFTRRSGERRQSSGRSRLSGRTMRKERRLKTASSFPRRPAGAAFVGVLVLIVGMAGLCCPLSARADPPTETQKPAPEGAPAAEELARAVASFFADLRSMKARFVEIDAKGTRREGVFLWERPGRFRFSYTDGTPLLIVSDGRQVSLVDEQAGTVSRWPVSQTALAPLLGKKPDPQRLKQAIRAIHPGPIPRLFWVEVADPAHPDRGSALLLFAREGSALSWLGWRVPDGQGGVIEVRLFDTQKNVAIAASAWRFKDPRRAMRRKRRGM